MCTWVLLKSIRFQDRLTWTHKENLEASAQGWYILIDSDLSLYRRKGTNHFGPHIIMECLFATWHAPHLLPNTTPTSALWHHIFQHPPLMPTQLLQGVRFTFVNLPTLPFMSRHFDLLLLWHSPWVHHWPQRVSYNVFCGMIGQRVSYNIFCGMIGWIQ